MTAPVAVIVGAAESDQIGDTPGKNALQLHAEAATNALAHAGLGMRDVDALYTCGLDLMPAMLMSEYLGLRPSVTGNTSIGGSSFVAHLHEAVHAIRARRCEVALITHGQTPRADRKRGVRSSGRHTDPTFPDRAWELPWGIAAPPTAYALAATRHMHLHGTTHEQLAEVAVAARAWAALNPRARNQQPITVDDVLASPWVVEPFHVLDCCLVTDAGGAVVVTTGERARDLDVPGVRVLGSAVAHTHQSISQMPELTVSPAAITGPRALGEAGVAIADLDVVEVYDSFTYTVVTQLEDLGFCDKGQGGAFVAGGRIAPGGALALNTSGGGLSYTHPGMFGIFLLIEAVCQLRGEAGARQVPDARLALVSGMGGYLSSAATAVLERA